MPPKGWKKKEQKISVEPEQPIEHHDGDDPTPLSTPKKQKPRDDVLFIDSILPKKDNYRIDEVAMHFDVSTSTIRTWIQNDILIGIKVGKVIRVPRRSIIECKFNHSTNILRET